jgi:hypothetical protein
VPRRFRLLRICGAGETERPQAGGYGKRGQVEDGVESTYHPVSDQPERLQDGTLNCEPLSNSELACLSRASKLATRLRCERCGACRQGL